MTTRWLGLVSAVAGALIAGAVLVGVAAGAVQAGPPYPDAVTGQRVYDYAGIFSASARSQAETTILAIEERTGAQVAVYTQVKPWSDTLDEANADALALMNQWGVGRKGFDDGLVILFDMETNLLHGQVSLYAGSGFKAAFLSNSDRQSIFDNDMLPPLKEADFDGALKIALDDVSAATTPEHADSLNRARILNALVGFGVFALALGLTLFAFFRWLTRGRDPMYLDDDSILMPAPPQGLTPAMATLIMSDRTSARTVSAAMVDLAARGLIEFRGEEHHKAGLAVTGKMAEVGGPEGSLMGAIRNTAGNDGVIEATSMYHLASAVQSLKKDIEAASVRKGWLTDRPSKVVRNWIILAVIEGVASYPLFIWTMDLGASGGILGGSGLVCAAIATALLAFIQPSRTQVGSMLRAMLAAYRRTLQYMMQRATSMEQVVESRVVPWITTPDQAMAWGIALGLNDEIDGILKRSLQADEAEGARTRWYPGWWVPYGSSSGHGFAGGGGGSAGLFSAGAMPDVGSMMSAIGSIGSSASHSSSGGSFGGGGGGGGGGAGGGF